MMSSQSGCGRLTRQSLLVTALSAVVLVAGCGGIGRDDGANGSDAVGASSTSVSGEASPHDEIPFSPRSIGADGGWIVSADSQLSLYFHSDVFAIPTEVVLEAVDIAPSPEDFDVLAMYRIRPAGFVFERSGEAHFNLDSSMFADDRLALIAVLDQEGSWVVADGIYINHFPQNTLSIVDGLIPVSGTVALLQPRSTAGRVTVGCSDDGAIESVSIPALGPLPQVEVSVTPGECG